MGVWIPFSRLPYIYLPSTVLHSPTDHGPRLHVRDGVSRYRGTSLTRKGHPPMNTIGPDGVSALCIDLTIVHTSASSLLLSSLELSHTQVYEP